MFILYMKRSTPEWSTCIPLPIELILTIDDILKENKRAFKQKVQWLKENISFKFDLTDVRRYIPFTYDSDNIYYIPPLIQSKYGICFVHPNSTTVWGI